MFVCALERIKRVQRIHEEKNVKNPQEMHLDNIRKVGVYLEAKEKIWNE